MTGAAARRPAAPAPRPGGKGAGEGRLAEGSKRPPLGEAARYAQVGLMLVAPMAALGYCGHWLDRRLGTGPWILLAGLILGMAGGFLNFFRLVLPPRGGPGGPGGRAE